MERIVLPLLICTSLVTATFNVTRREKGDRFVWSGTRISCSSFAQGTAYQWDYNDDICECSDFDNPGRETFSTQSNKCESYAGVDDDEGKEL